MHSGGNASSLPLVGGAPEPTINQLSKPGRRASRFPKLDVPVTEINNSAIRNDKPSLPEVSDCLLYTSPSPRDYGTSRMPSSA